MTPPPPTKQQPMNPPSHLIDRSTKRRINNVTLQLLDPPGQFHNTLAAMPSMATDEARLATKSHGRSMEMQTMTGKHALSSAEPAKLLCCSCRIGVRMTGWSAQPQLNQRQAYRDEASNKHIHKSFQRLPTSNHCGPTLRESACSKE